MQITSLQSAAAFSLGLFLSGCCGQPDINTYAGKEPVITVRDFYGAPVEGYGFAQDRSGKVTDRYFATLVPTWNGNDATVIENQWNDQGQLYFHQVWKLHASDDGRHFTATASKIDGQVVGETSGYAMHMTYSLFAPTKKGDDVEVAAQDWTYLQPDGDGINKVALSKYGVHVADVTYVLHRVPEGEEPQQGYAAQ